MRKKDVEPCPHHIARNEWNWKVYPCQLNSKACEIIRSNSILKIINKSILGRKKVKNSYKGNRTRSSKY